MSGLRTTGKCEEAEPRLRFFAVEVPGGGFTRSTFLFPVMD